MPRTVKTERRATSKPALANAGERRLKVWRFTDFEGRFAATGMPNGMEVAQYAKWYLNAWQGPGAEWLVALNRLRGEKDFIWYQGAVVELLTAAMNQGSEYQGYLVTGRKVPMQASDVGSILRIDGRRAGAVLTRLEQVGILDRVDWPMPDGGSDGDISDDRSLRLLQNVAEASRKAQRKGGGKRSFRNENEGPPLKVEEKVERSAAQTTVEESKGPPGVADDAGRPGKGGPITCPKCGHVGTPKKAAKGWGANAVQCTQCGHVARNDETSISKTSITSTSPDGGGGPGSDSGNGRNPGRKASPASDSSHVVKMADVLAGRRHRYSQAGNEFGDRVIAALGLSYKDQSDYANEQAHWAKLYEQAASELTETGVCKVVAKVMRVAADVRRGTTQATNPQAFLMTTMKNEIRDQKRAHRVQAG